MWIPSRLPRAHGNSLYRSVTPQYLHRIPNLAVGRVIPRGRRFNSNKGDHQGTNQGVPKNSRTFALLAATIGAGSVAYAANHKSPVQDVIAASNRPPPVNGQKDIRPWDDLRGTIYPALSYEAATAKLREEEESHSFLGQGVSRVDSLRLSSNHPVEDELAYESLSVGNPEDWNFWGVYDGHAGWATSAVLRRSLIRCVAQELQNFVKGDAGDSSTTVDKAIENGFLKLDDKIVEDGIKAMNDGCTPAEALSRIAPARAGSCALLAVHDPNSSDLRVACVGDSRAILGRQIAAEERDSEKSDYRTVFLSQDQTGFNDLEYKRLQDEHPGETEIVDRRTGRVLGMMISRAFGDNRWKWPVDSLKQWHERFLGQPMRPHYHTPPYLTAKPVITNIKVQDGDFLILASDGFWDRMSSTDAVECVRLWMQKGKPESFRGDAPSGSGESKDESSPGIPNFYQFDKKDFVLEDDNVATHLARNALGGRRKDVFQGLLSIQAPESRAFRDDITIQVIFFSDSLENQERK